MRARTSPRGVAQAVVQAGVQTDARLLYYWFRLSQQDRQIRAGNYELTAGTTPRSLLQKLVRGEESLRAITFVEGWTFRQMRALIAKDEFLKHDTVVMSEADIMAALGKPGVAAEGHVLPGHLHLCQRQQRAGSAAPRFACHGAPFGRDVGAAQCGHATEVA